MEKRKKGKPITISFWNKELSLLANKQGDIIEVIQKYKPLVLGIGWTQLKTNNNLADVQQPGFTLHLDSCQASLGVSWCAVYSRNSMVVKRLEDLENGGIATVWLQLGIPGQKGIVIMCGYCQWRLPNQVDKGAASSLVQAHFVKYVWNIEISNQEPKKNQVLFLQVFRDSHFFLKYFLHFWYCIEMSCPYE